MLGLRLSDRQAKWIAFFKLIVLARVGYAAVLFVQSRLELLGVPTILSTDEHMVALLFTLNPFIHALWTVYVAGYVAAAILIWRNDPRGPLVYIAAFLLDAVMWIAISFFPFYELAWSGMSVVIDMGFNLLDLGLITVMLLWFRPRLLQSSASGA